jgi:hypothetical protein
MKKITVLAICLATLFSINESYADSITKIFDGYKELNSVNSGGLYRVVDKTAGVVVYIMTTGLKGTEPQIHTVPFALLDPENKRKLMQLPNMNQ